MVSAALESDHDLSTVVICERAKLVSAIWGSLARRASSTKTFLKILRAKIFESSLLLHGRA